MKDHPHTTAHTAHNPAVWQMLEESESKGNQTQKVILSTGNQATESLTHYLLELLQYSSVHLHFCT